LIRVALIGPPQRSEIERLAIRLEERGAEAIVLDARSDPEVVLGEKDLQACGESLSGIRGVYVCDLAITPPVVADAGGAIDLPASLAMLDRSRRRLSAWNTLLTRLQRLGANVVNPPETHALHVLKPYETMVYERSGAAVPVTVATNQTAALMDLPGGVTSGWITKGMAGGYFHTETFDPPKTTEEAARFLDGMPRMVQERIQGDNVRAFVVGGRCIVAGEIAPRLGAEVDSRRGETRLKRIEIPKEAEEAAIAAAARWGMPFAAVDFMRDATTGRFVILECNSAPFFVTFEAMTGVDISGALATLLVGRRKE
jgi:glutathione synthase/RimK-type ligase-like ATP-grasp enzyme